MKSLFLILTAAVTMFCKDFPTLSVPTPNGNEVVLTMIHHGSVAVSYKNYNIQIDPVAAMDKDVIDYSSFPKADLILVSHEHGDHLDTEAVKALSKEGTAIYSNEGSLSKLGGAAKAMANGDSAVINADIKLFAVPAYNFTEGHTQFHPKGHGNGYVLEIDGLRIYISGDTEDIPELSQLKNIDVAFLSTNQPYTMTVEQCRNAVKAFGPKMLIPYHYSNTDLTPLVEAVKAMGIEVKTYETLR